MDDTGPAVVATNVGAMARRRRAVAAALLIVAALTGASLALAPAARADTKTAWNFQPAGSPLPSGYLPDSGHVYDAGRGYGWQIEDGQTRQCGDRSTGDLVRATFCHAQTIYTKGSDGKWTNTASPASWHASVAAGTYDVTVIVGEATSHPTWVRHSVQVEGVVFVDRGQTTKSTPFIEVIKTVTVDTSLDVSFDGGEGTKIVAVSMAPAVSDSGPTTFDIWHGNDQTFGANGIPQRFANLLGNVVDPDGVASLEYRVNSGSWSALTIGPNQRRLQRTGDFNAEILFSQLAEGANTVTLRAIDGRSNVSTQAVTVRKAPATTWPLPYTADWSAVSSLTDAAQVVDGKWGKVTGGVRPTEVGFDRLLDIGDVAVWQNYEARMPITIHAVDPAGYVCPACGPGIGMVLRWDGHKDDGFQPRREVRPLGSVGWYRYTSSGNALVITDSQAKPAVSDSTRVLDLGKTYVFKFRVDTQADGSHLYRLKVWDAATTEPSAWDLQYTAPSTAPQRGSLLLLAHYVDATFGNVTVNGTVSAPSPSSVTFFDRRATIDGTNYNWDSAYQTPADLAQYTSKKATIALTLHSKASTLDTRMQVCAWRKGTDGTYGGSGSDETCSPLVGAIRTTGGYTFQVPEPKNWWAKSGKGKFDWSKNIDRVGIIVKDYEYGSPPPLLNYSNCGSSCHPEGESYVTQHVPIDFQARVTFFK